MAGAAKRPQIYERCGAKNAMSHPSDDMAKMPLGKLLSIVCVQAAIFTAVGVQIWWLSGRELSQFVTIDIRQVLLGVAIACTMIVLGLALFRGFPRFGEKLIRDQAHSLAFLKNKLGIGPIIILSLCAGIWEEALFRGGILVIANDFIPFWLALIVSAGLFTVIHFAKPAVAAFIFAMGCIFGYLYFALGSLLAVMIGHALYDVWALWFVQAEMHRLGVFDEECRMDVSNKISDGSHTSDSPAPGDN